MGQDCTMFKVISMAEVMGCEIFFDDHGVYLEGNQELWSKGKITGKYPVFLLAHCNVVQHEGKEHEAHLMYHEVSRATKDAYRTMKFLYILIWAAQCLPGPAFDDDDHIYMYDDFWFNEEGMAFDLGEPGYANPLLGKTVEEARRQVHSSLMP